MTSPLPRRRSAGERSPAGNPKPMPGRRPYLIGHSSRPPRIARENSPHRSLKRQQTATIELMPTSRHPSYGVRGSGGSGDLRQGNLTSILRYVRDHGSSSRHDIAQGCGLGISTMTDLISELRSRRLVKELDPIRRPAAGRPTRPIALDGEPWCALGIQIDVDYIRFSAVTVGGREVWSASIPVDLRESG